MVTRKNLENVEHFDPYINRIKLFVSIDEFGNLEALDNNYSVADSGIYKGRRLYILGKSTRFCYDYCKEIITSLSPLPNNLCPKFQVSTKYRYANFIKIYNNKKSIIVPNNNQNAIAFKTLNMGWINCDRFINNENPIIVKVENKEKLNVVLLTKEYNSLMNSSIMNDQSIFYNIPNNLDITLIAYKKNDDKTYSFTYSENKACKEIISIPNSIILSEAEFHEN